MFNDVLKCGDAYYNYNYPGVYFTNAESAEKYCGNPKLDGAKVHESIDPIKAVSGPVRKKGGKGV